MRESDYVALYVRTDPRYCCVDDLGSLENPGDLAKAVSVVQRFPEGLKVDLAMEGGDLITDFINNSYRILIASEKAKLILETEGVAGSDVEYLPIVLRDRRNKPLGERFFIVNVLRVVSCFDWDRSVYETFSMSPREISVLDVLHIVPNAIPRDAKLFRLGEERRELIFRTDLLERLRREGCEGLCVVPMGQERI